MLRKSKKLFNRYYKKDEIDFEALRITQTEAQCIGENEVFQATQPEKIWVDTLSGKCSVWTLEEYDGKSGLGAQDFYTRAKYDPILVQLSVF